MIENGTTAPRDRGALVTVFGLGAMALCCLFLCERAWPFTTDDAYITLRYARLWASGQGLRFNPGEPPVEGYSSFVFLLKATAALQLGFDPVLLLKTTGALSLFATGVVTFLLARYWLPRWLGLLPAFVVVSYLGSAWWAVSGLETGLAQLVTVGALLLVVAGLGYRVDAAVCGEPRIGLLAAAGALVAFAGLVRPEAPVLGGVLGLAVVWRAAPALRGDEQVARRQAWLGLAAFWLLFLLPYAAYFGWRMSHFGRLLPNPVYCKAAFTGDPWSLLGEVGRELGPLLLLAALLPVRLRDVRTTLLLGLPLAQAVVLYGVDPIVGYHARHFLPVLAPLAVAASVSGWQLLSRIPGVAARTALVWLTGVALAPWPKPSALRDEADFYARRMTVRSELARYLDQHVGPSQWVMLGDAGLVPYRSHAKYIDAYCLNSREMPLPPIAFSPPAFARFALGKRPAAIVVSSMQARRMEPQPDLGTWTALLREPAFAAQYRLALVMPTERFVAYWVYLRQEP